MTIKDFVPLTLIAQLAGVSRQAVWKACQRGSWRGYRLEIRVAQGKGGNAGKQCLVSLTSLPPELQLRLEATGTLVHPSRPIASRGRRRRADRGKKRVVISRRWEGLVPFDPVTKAKIAEDLKQEIRGLLAAGSSWGHVKILARNFLIETTMSWGFLPTDPDSFEEACSIPWTFINRDVIEVFAAMAEHPAFGLPEALYIDNGKEYGFATYLDDAKRLSVPGFHGPGRSMRVINALPYNAPAQPIERWFGDFESRYLSTLPGWIAGNRMNKRQEAVGRTVTPYGNFEDFVPAFFGLLRAYHSVPTGKQSGLRGLSPNAAFQKHADAGWAAMTVARDEVRAAVARRVQRTVRQGALQIRGRRWSCEELWRCTHDRVLVCEPVYHAPAELLVLDMKGNRLGIATPDVALHPLDPRGAQSTAARARAHRDAIAEMVGSIPQIDVAARLTALGQGQSDVISNKPAGNLFVDASQRPARIVMPKKPLISEERRREQDARIAAQMDLVKKIVG